jgi:hypothetical protein
MMQKNTETELTRIYVVTKKNTECGLELQKCNTIDMKTSYMHVEY